MPDALRRQGLLRNIGAADGGAVIPPMYCDAIETSSGVRNGSAIARYSKDLASRLRQIFDQDTFPIILGGDCSILIGSALALSSRGRYGLLFLDGHSDLLDAQSSLTKGVAGMDLAIVTGRGPKALTNLNARRPYLQDSDVVLFAYRWPLPGQNSPASPPAEMHAFPLQRVRDIGIKRSIHQALAILQSSQLDGFFIHLDVDVLNPSIMPAVDSPDPGGLSYSELQEILTPAVRSRRAVGLEITIFDPSLDPDGIHARELSSFVSHIFS